MTQATKRPVLIAGNNDKLIDVGNNIRKWRCLKSLKQEFLAQELEISMVSVSKIETGKTDVSLTRLFAIALILDIPIQLLFSDPAKIVESIYDRNGQ